MSEHSYHVATSHSTMGSVMWIDPILTAHQAGTVLHLCNLYLKKKDQKKTQTKRAKYKTVNTDINL